MNIPKAERILDAIEAIEPPRLKYFGGIGRDGRNYTLFGPAFPNAEIGDEVESRGAYIRITREWYGP